VKPLEKTDEQKKAEIEAAEKRGQPYTGPIKEAIVKTKYGEERIHGEPKAVDCTIKINALYEAYNDALAAENQRQKSIM